MAAGTPVHDATGKFAHSAKLCKTIDAATVTFSDAVPPPCCGMNTKSSQIAT